MGARKISAAACLRRGATVVEMAVAAPVVIVMVLGLMEVARAFMVQHLLQDAARHGCRSAICPQSTNAAVSATVGDLLLADGLSTASTTILVQGATADLTSAGAGSNVTVRVSIAAADVSVVPGTGYLRGQLTASYTLRRE